MKSCPTNSSEKSSPKNLFHGKRFLPLFITQFFGSFNDNAFKNAFLIWFTFAVINYHGFDASIMVSFAAGLFILPFFLFSATAGQLADKYEKSKLTKIIKAVEIILMLFCALFFYLENVIGLLVVLFMMGVQSTFFGPIKYALLPEHLESEELILANGWIEGGTFLSILFGTLFGGLVILTKQGFLILSISVILFAIIGYVGSTHIPKSKIADTNLTIGWNIFKETKKIICFAKQEKIVWFSINAISWFWLIGAMFLTQLPLYTKEYIHGEESVVTLFLAIFSVGIGVGSVLCNVLLKGEVSGRHVPKACLAMSFFIMSFVFASYAYDTQYHLTPFAQGDIINFLKIGFPSFGIILSLLGISIMSGLYIVPLYAIMQKKSDEQHISRIIASNNVMNALFMVLSSVFALIMFYFGFSILDIFSFLTFTNLIIFILLLRFFRKIP